jgi:hypothetical protein
MKAVKSLIKRKEATFPGDKKIMFVQWVQAAIMVGTMLEELGIRFVYYWV